MISPTPEDVSGWTQLLWNMGIGLAAFGAGAIAYIKRRPARSDIEFAGGLVSSRDIEPLTHELRRVADALERGLQQEEDRVEAEREREVETLRRELEEERRRRSNI